MRIEPNEGQRPSRLQLDRYATGELSAEEAAMLAARLGPDESAHLAALERARAELPPFDPRALRTRIPRRPANNTRWYVVVGLLAAAAAVLFGLRAPDPAGGDIQFRSGDGALDVYELHGTTLVPYDGDALGQGDVLGFQVTPADHRGVVVLSVDGTGAISVFYPASGDDPEPVRAGAAHVALPDSVVLDGAPGPEIFVAVFDRPVSEAKALVAARYREGGHPALLSWAEQTAGVATVEVRRR